MDWAKFESYDRILDIHLFNKDNYDFLHDVIPQLRLHKKWIDEVNRDPNRYLKEKGLLVPTKAQWQKESRVGIFAGRRGETEDIDDLLSKYSKSKLSSERYAILDAILYKIDSYLARAQEGKRIAAYRNLKSIIKRAIDYTSGGATNNLPTVICDYVIDNSVMQLASKIRPSPSLNDIRSFSLIDLRKRLKPRDLEFRGVEINGYISVFIDISEVKNEATNQHYATLIEWVSAPGRLGKIRLNCHGDGLGNLSMRQKSISETDGTITKGSKELCTGVNVVNWLCNNGYFSNFNLGVNSGISKSRSTNRAQNFTNNTIYYGTIVVAACMAARGAEEEEKNPSAIQDRGKSYDRAHDKSLIDIMAKTINKKRLPSIKITGAHELVKNNADVGLMRVLYLFIYDDPNKDHKVNKIGKDWVLTTTIPSAFYTSSSQKNDYLTLTDKEWQHAKGPGRSYFMNRKDNDLKFGFDEHTYVIYHMDDAINGERYIFPPHGTRFELINNFVCLIAPFEIVIDKNATHVSETFARIAKADAKIAIITNDNS